MIEQPRTQDRATSSLDPVIIDHFNRLPKAPLYHVYSNSEQTRHFHILPNNPRMLFTCVENLSKNLIYYRIGW
jgi:hypothetical protein